LKVAVQAPPREAGIDSANWNWKVVREFVQQHFGRRLSRSSCLNYLHRLGFVLKRPKKRLLKANAAVREAFVLWYARLLGQTQQRGAKIFFEDEAHFRADGDLRGKWVLKGQPALVDSTSPRRGEKASYYSAVCLETGEVEVMELTGNSTAETSTTFLRQLRGNHPEPLVVIWDNAPAHRGQPIREYLRTPDLNLQLAALPPYSPDFNGDEAIWGWVREEVTANTCLGTRAIVQEKVGEFFQGLADRTVEVKQRCRTELQARAGTLKLPRSFIETNHVDFTLALV
jgi:transposase